MVYLVFFFVIFHARKKGIRLTKANALKCAREAVASDNTYQYRSVELSMYMCSVITNYSEGKYFAQTAVNVNLSNWLTLLFGFRRHICMVEYDDSDIYGDPEDDYFSLGDPEDTDED